MQVTRTDTSPCNVVLDVAFTPEQVSEGFKRALKTIGKSLNLPGFRPGKAPLPMIEARITEDQWKEEAAEEIVRMTFNKLMQGQSLEPYGRPSVSALEITREPAVCTMSLKVPLQPIIELGEYRGLEAKKPSVSITEEDVDQQIEDIRKRKSTREVVTDRGVQEKDVAVVNIKIAGVEGDGRNFMTIAGQTFTGLDSALIGMQVEEMKNVELEFPDSFQEKDWAGQKHECQVTVRSLNAVILPELDDQFAQQFNLDNVDEMRVRVRERLADMNAGMIQDYVNEQLLTALIEKSNVDVPDNMWETVASRRLQDVQAEQREKGKTLEDYAKDNGMTLEQLIEAWKKESKTQVIRAVVVREVFTKENMTLNNDELTRELIQMAQEYEMDPEAMLAALREREQMDELHFRAIFRKVTEFLTQTATLTEVSAN